MDPREIKFLTQRWLHSHEEDTNQEIIYRPFDYPFPPSRGRSGFELKPDGSAVNIGIAARDGTAESDCVWELQENDEAIVLLKYQNGRRLTLSIVSVENDRLAIRK